MYEFIEGKYVKIFCLTKYNYIIDNILTYYDTEEYEGVLFYIMLSYVVTDAHTNFNKIIFYNLEHLFTYGGMGHDYEELVKKCINNGSLYEFWDFDILNYTRIVKSIPELIKYYKFKPLRYVEYEKIDNSPKKFDAIQIGVTRDFSPYRNNALWNISKKNRESFENNNFSLLNIEQSRYSLNELYDEINSSKVVLNIPRFSNTGQEQLRIGHLISMNCTVATQSFNISYLSEYVKEINFFSDTIFEDLQSIKQDEFVAEKFKNQTYTEEKYKEYIEKCMEKWYNYKNSYLFTVSITAIRGESLEKTIKSIEKSNIFNRIQILVTDVGDETVYKCYEKYKHFDNIHYLRLYDKDFADSKNISLKCAVGKYIIFVSSGVLFMPLCFDDILKEIEKDDEHDIYIYPCTKNGKIWDLTFEENEIGPILECCVFKRNKIDIDFERNMPCYSIIFSGIMCKHKKYIYHHATILSPVSMIDCDGKNDEDLFFKLMPNKDWILFSREKIIES